ncbi:unnamed protein product [Cyprideis torosa]|uniref:5'-AMP-activated protein kinase subunit beta-1 n=1 Tax=Cyprideis torosa TaxID=163714 RepID=A0A7R8WLB0_9CRUS|nr:unnamed protein product [Cyprideis torosa]CAG0897050.1 unnamed protein product [Cyprideis torosa]
MTLLSVEPIRVRHGSAGATGSPMLDVGYVGRPRSNTISTHTRPTFSTGMDPSQGLPTMFKWEGSGKEVYICGTFTNWKPLPMVKSTKDFVAIVNLKEGEHQYKFMVDGEWKHDTKKKSVENDCGTVNNLIQVQRSDFEALEALAIDSAASKKKEGTGTQSDGASTEQGNEKGSWHFSQETPGHTLLDKPTTPPVLPPHLLEVILNKDTPMSCEPTLLPEPHHVMLNHLYALSIRDGVMVLSATHRYRKKYVTSLLYKPI